MRTLLDIDVIQARNDAANRIYRPRIELWVKTEGPIKVDLVTWAIDKLLKEHPWHDKLLREVVEDDRMGRVANAPKTYEVNATCVMTWIEEKGYFESLQDMIPLRRGQMVAFENWVAMIVQALRTMEIPTVVIKDVQAHVEFTRWIRSLPHLTGSWED